MPNLLQKQISLSSIDNVVLQLKEIKNRFPWGVAMIFGLWVVGILVAVYSDSDFNVALHQESKDQTLYSLVKVGGWFYLNAMMISALELVFGLYAQSGKVISKAKQNALKSFIIVLNAGVLLWVFPLSFKAFEDSDNELSGVFLTKIAYFIGYVWIAKLLVLLSGALPNWKKSKQLLYLWNSLLLAIVVCAAFSAVIMIGIGIAIATVNLFFKIEAYRLLPYIFVTVAMLFAPLKGLSLLPSVEKMLEAKLKIDNISRFFTKRIVASLALVYQALLYLFAIKQLIAREWPEQSIVFTVLWLLIPVVILAVINFSERYVEEKPSLYDILILRGIHFLSIPMVIMYLMSMWVRIGDYGITIPRYIVLMFGLWLLAFNVYWAAMKKPRLAFIPVSIIVALIISIYIPFVNMFAVSENSQVHRLEAELRKYNALNPDGTLNKEAIIGNLGSVGSDSDIVMRDGSRVENTRGRVSFDYTIVRYLKDYHFTPELLKKKPYLKELSEMTSSGDDYTVEETATIHFHTDSSNDLLDISANSKVYLDQVNLYKESRETKLYPTENNSNIEFRLRLNEFQQGVNLYLEDRVMNFELKPVIDSLRSSIEDHSGRGSYKDAAFPQDAIRQVTIEDSERRYTFYITSLSLKFSIDKNTGKASELREVNTINGFLIVSEK